MEKFNSKNPESEFFITRHTKKPGKEEVSPEEYPGISKGGVELAKERVKDIVKLIEDSPEGTIIPLLGVSPMERTRSTMKVYSEGIKESFKGKPDIVMISRGEIKSFYEEKKGVHKTIEAIKKRVEENPRAKVIIEFPLMLKELSDDRWWKPEDKDKPQEERRLGPYVDHLGGVKRFREQRSEAIKQWFGEKGIINNEQVGPNPQEIAEGHIKALKRLEEFSRKIFPNKPLNIVIVGHSLEMDSLFTYLANNGQITSEGFEKIGAQEFKETEPAQIKLNQDGTFELNYRGKNFIFNPSESYDEEK